MNDPTYDRVAIDANPTWRLAFLLSELQNDNAPLGWGKYIWIAESLLRNCDIAWKEPKS